MSQELKTEIKERGIPYSGPMIVSTLKDWKTMTRRTKALDGINESPDDWTFDRVQDGYADGIPRFVFIHTDGESVGIKCPYGVPGDILYAREAWRLPARWDEYSGAELALLFPDVAQFPIRYEADGFERNVKTNDIKWGRYRHARFMPRWASRITTEINGIKVERLRDISEADAKAEGVDRAFADYETFGCRAAGLYLYRDYSAPKFNRGWETARPSFKSLWEMINEPGSWKANPFVFVISFKKVD